VCDATEVDSSKKAGNKKNQDVTRYRRLQEQDLNICNPDLSGKLFDILGKVVRRVSNNLSIT
jgi:hypothetical protein